MLNDWKKLISTEQMQTGTEAQQVYFIQRTAQMSPKEWRLMKAACYLNEPETLADVINLSFNLHHFGFFYPANDQTTLGKCLARQERIIDDDELMQAIDWDSYARSFMETHPGVFVGGAYVAQAGRPDSMEKVCESVGDGPLKDRDYSAKIRLAGPQGNKVWLRLPNYEEINGGKPDELTVVLAELGAESLAECVPLEAHCVLSQVTNLLGQYDDLEKLVFDASNLGFALEDQNQGERHYIPKLLAAIKYENCNRLDEVLDIVENIDCYEYHPRDSEALVALGKEIATEKGIHSKSGIAGFVDYEMLAHFHLRDKGMQSIEGGYFGRNRKLFISCHKTDMVTETDAPLHDNQEPEISM